MIDSREKQSYTVGIKQTGEAYEVVGEISEPFKISPYKKR